VAIAATAVVVVRLGIDAPGRTVIPSVRAGADAVLAGASAATDDATAAAVVVVLLDVGACGAAAAGLARFAAVAPARDIAIHRVAAPPGIVTESRPVPADLAGVTAPWRPRRPGVTRLRGGHIQQRPHGAQDRDHPKDTSSFHGSLLLRCWSVQGGAIAVVTRGQRPAGAADLAGGGWAWL